MTATSTIFVETAVPIDISGPNEATVTGPAFPSVRIKAVGAFARPPRLALMQAPLILGLLLFTAGPSLAQESLSADPHRILQWPVEDAGALIRGISSPRAAYVLGAGGILAFISIRDGSVSRRAERLHHAAGPVDDVTRAVEELGNEKAMRPVAFMLLMGTLVSGEPRLQDAALTSLESVLFANLVTNGLKAVSGRARPYQEEGAASFKPFSGNTSFPSGHATTVFAFVTPWFVYYPNYVTGSALVLAGATAASRVTTHKHWMSDVAGGAAIGFSMAYWLSRRHLQQSRRVRLYPAVLSEGMGVSIRVDH